ncbi:MAG: hypothetical protein NT027_08740 [Proteobacteria bacterium]|nr:hypothetical protein [Pseudomonadota bacterium]
MKKTTLIALTSLASAWIATTSFSATFRDPLNETAHFQLDKSSDRTSRLVSKGTIDNTVSRIILDANGNSYGVTMDYDVSMKVTGSFKDSFEMVFPENFFTPNFIENLRRSGLYTSKDYKIKYEGQSNASTQDGKEYPNSDVLLIYDISVDAFAGLSDLLTAAAGFDPSNKDLPMTDMKIKAHVFQGIPALSAVKLDLTGKIKGVPSKLGFDYVSP